MNIIYRQLLVVSLLLVAAFGAVAADSADGEKLERQMWADIKAQNWSAVTARIASDFQSVHPDGARDRSAEISLIKGLKLGDYKLKDFEVTQNDDEIVITYWISVQETIDGKKLSGKPAPRLSVWQKTKAGWQWIAHANLNPID